VREVLMLRILSLGGTKVLLARMRIGLVITFLVVAPGLLGHAVSAVVVNSPFHFRSQNRHRPRITSVKAVFQLLELWREIAIGEGSSKCSLKSFIYVNFTACDKWSGNVIPHAPRAKPFSLHTVENGTDI
jgi:hypothetical protein